MKKVLKRITIGMLIVLAIGIVLLITGNLLGGSFSYAVDMKNHKMYVPESGKEEYISKTIDVEDFQNLNIELDCADLEIRQGEEYQVAYNVSAWNEPVVKVENDTLTISDEDKETVQISWDFDILGIIKIKMNQNEEPEKVVVTVPDEVLLKSLEMKVSYGDMYIENMQITNYNITAESGSLTLVNTKIDNGTIYAESGDVEWKSVEGNECVITAESGACMFEDIQMNKLSLDVEYGDIGFVGAKVDKLITEADSGTITMNQLSGSLVDIYAEYGDLSIDNSTIDNINANCESGEVDISLNGSAEDYDFDITVESGDLEINGKEESNAYKDMSGREKRITIQSEYGDVDINMN